MPEQVSTTSTDTPAAPAQATPTEAVNSGTPQSAKLYTEAELTQRIRERADRATEATQKKILSELGLTSVEELSTLKQVIEDARKRKESDMTEAQKLQAERDAIKKEKDDALTQLNAERAERRNDRIASYLLSEAAKMKAADAETVLMYARDKHKAALDAIMGEDGTLDTKKAAALLETIKSEKALYFQAVIPGGGSPSNAGGRAQPGSKDKEQAAAILRRQIRTGF